MAINSKKLVAREFLILLCSIILFFVVVFIWLTINSTNEDKISSEINILKNNLHNIENRDSLPFRLQVTYLIIDKYPEYKNDKLGLITRSKSAKNFARYHKNLTDDKLIDMSIEDFTKKITADNSSEKHLKKIEILEKSIKAKDDCLNRIYNVDERITIFGVILLIIIYPLRVLLYATKWSIKTIKS